jgi:AraC-like DNA-binding protein
LLTAFLQHAIFESVAGRMAQLVRAPRSHRGDRWFKSSCAQLLSTNGNRAGKSTPSIDSVVRHNQMRRSICFIVFLLTIVVAVFAVPDVLKKCIRFKAPDQKSVITIPVCTLGVDSSCKEIEKVEIRARYCPNGADTLIETNIGTITKPPFLKIWDLSAIPNQLAIGVGVLIIVTFADGDAYGLHREGIFLAHQSITYPPEQQVPYEYPGTNEFPADTVRIVQGKTGAIGFAQIYWNEKGVTFSVSVNDTLLDTSASQKILEQSGVEILVDPVRKKRPYPTDDIMRFIVPLAGKPYRITYQPIFNDGQTYQLKLAIARGAFEYSIEKKNRTGFTVVFSIPCYLFGKSLPSDMDYNIIVKTTNRKLLSLINSGNGYNHYSPLLWPSLTILPKPLVKTRWIILLVSFLAGFFMILSGYAVVVLLTNSRPRVILIRVPDAEKRSFEKLKEALDRHVIQKDMTSASIASELNISPSQLETTVKKSTGMKFKNYAMYLRTEIVCERLRSSYSSEASIAESCGFRNVKEQERWFRHFHHMTPQNFRRIQQVTQTQ